VDVTIGLSAIASATERELAKRRKFAAQLLLHPRLGFTPFGATLDGDIGVDANSIVATWCRTLGTRNAARLLPPGNHRGEIVTEVSRAFVRALVFQAAQWMLHSRNAPRGTGR
jgi:hypothetical protein